LIGCILLELNELDDAEQALRFGLEVGQWMPSEEVPGYLALARLCGAKYDSLGQAETLRRLDMRWPDIHYCTEAARMANLLRAKNEDCAAREAAASWAAAHIPEIGPDIPVPGIGPAWNAEADYAAYTAWAQVQILLSRPDEALFTIQPLLAMVQSSGLVHRQIDLLLLQAQAHYTRGDRIRCWQSLIPALTHAEREGYLRLADQGPLLVRMLNEAAGLGMATRFIALLLPDQKIQAPLPGEAAPRGTLRVQISGLGGLVEPLSARELQVLALMTEGLSNAEIAARLYLSPNTMKTHAHNIYSKLDVHTRVQAVNKARDLKII
jgi:DNA-binding CsgD family transcriptional regulator